MTSVVVYKQLSLFDIADAHHLHMDVAASSEIL